MSSNKNSDDQIVSAKALMWCAGADHTVLRSCSIRERMKYSGLGFAMIFVAALAGFAFGFSVFESTHSLKFAIPAGAVWSAGIFSIDRLLLITIRKAEDEADKRKERFLGVVRVLMIFVVSFLVSDAMVQQVFRQEVDAELVQMTEEKSNHARTQAELLYKNKIEEWQRRKGEIEGIVEGFRKEWQEKESAAIREAEGTSGSKIPGRGRLYGEKFDIAGTAKEAYENAANKYKPELDELAGSIKDAEDKINKAQADAGRAQGLAKGMLARNQALLRLVRSDFGALIIWACLMMGLFFLESLPLSIKMLTRRGEYDVKLDLREREAINQATQNDKVRADTIKQMSDARIALTSDTLKRVTDALNNNTVSTLADDERKLAERIRGCTIVDISNFFEGSVSVASGGANTAQDAADWNISGKPSGADLPDKPSTVLVKVSHQNDSAEAGVFAITFNLVESEVQGSDLDYALKEQVAALLPVEEGWPALHTYQLTNTHGDPIRLDRPLFFQLKEQPIVNVGLTSPRTSNGTQQVN